MKSNKIKNLYGVNEDHIIAEGNRAYEKLLNENDGSGVDATEFENELIDIFAETIAINQMVNDRTLKSIACLKPITNTIANINSINVYDPDHKLSSITNSTFSGRFSHKDRESIPDVEIKVYEKGDLFKLNSVIFEAVDSADIKSADMDGITEEIFSGKVRYCSESKVGEVRSFVEGSEVDIKNINFRGRVKNRSAFLSYTPTAFMDMLTDRDLRINSVPIDIKIGDEYVTVYVNQFLIGIAQYIANERNKDILHTAIAVSKKNPVYDLSASNDDSYVIGRNLFRKIQESISDITNSVKLIPNYVVVSQNIADYLASSNLVTRYTEYTPYSYRYDEPLPLENGDYKKQLNKPDHIHSNMYVGNALIVIDVSAEMDYFMVGVNDHNYEISGLYLSDQNLVLDHKDFGLSFDLDRTLNFGSINLLSVQDPNNFSTRIMALSKYALTVYPTTKMAHDTESKDRVIYTDDITEMANKSELINFTGVKLPK